MGPSCSAIRKAAGIEFPGWEASISALIAAVEMEEPELGLRYSDVGVSGIGPIGEGERETLRVVIAEQELNTGEADFDDLCRAASTPCSTKLARPSSTSATQARLSSELGATGSRWSTPATRVLGSFRLSVRSPPRPPS